MRGRERKRGHGPPGNLASGSRGGVGIAPFVFAPLSPFFFLELSLFFFFWQILFRSENVGVPRLEQKERSNTARLLECIPRDLAEFGGQCLGEIGIDIITYPEEGNNRSPAMRNETFRHRGNDGMVSKTNKHI